MRPVAAILTIAGAAILTITAAYLQRGEFGVGPEWVIPIILAFVIPIKEKEKENEHFKKRIYKNTPRGCHR